MSISLLMDRIGSRKIEEMETSAEHALEFQARERRIRQLGQRLLTEGLDLEGLIRVALDGLIECLGFERGFLVVAKQAPPLEEEEEGESPFDIFGARAARRQDAPDGELEFEEVPNPEFAINHSAVKRAFHSVKAITIHDSLSQPHSGGQEAHRSVLCQPFSLAP